MNATHRWFIVAVCLAVVSAMPAFAQRERAAGTDVRGILKSVDPNANTITIAQSEGREAAANEKTFTMAKNVEVAVGGGDRRAFGVLQPGKLTELTAGIPVTLTLSADGKTVECIVAEGPMIRGILKSADAQKRAITVTQAFGRGRDGDAVAEEKTVVVGKDAEIGIDDGRGRRFSIKEGRFEDLATGSIVTVRLSIDQKTAVSVFAEGPMLNGTVKSVDAAKNVLVVKIGGGDRGGDGAEERTLTVPAGAAIIIDDGKGKRLSLQEGKLADVPAGAMVTLKMSVDQQSVGFIRVQGPMVPGQLKSVDAKKGTITVLRPVARGENPEEKTYDVAKDARINIEGKDATLADLKVDDSQFLMLQLSLDSKTVQSITLGGRRRERE